MQTRMGDAGPFLLNNISRLSPFLDQADLLDFNATVTPDVSLMKFAIACKNFLRSMTCEEHPIIFVLDDLQWMDEESQHLITFLLCEQELKNVLFVMMYRGDGIHKELMSDLIKSIGTPFLDIPLGKLTADAVYHPPGLFNSFPAAVDKHKGTV